MKKVKEYLDKNLIASEGPHSCELKENGHYGVQGHWVYPKDYDPSKYDLELPSRDHMSIIINNETILVGNMSAGGKWSTYNYLQTYEHIPRGKSDDNGYYARSTESEVIKYLDSYFKIIIANEIIIPNKNPSNQPLKN